LFLEISVHGGDCLQFLSRRRDVMFAEQSLGEIEMRYFEVYGVAERDRGSQTRDAVVNLPIHEIADAQKELRVGRTAVGSNGRQEPRDGVGVAPLPVSLHTRMKAGIFVRRSPEDGR